jgi:histidinol dehydrogenase
MNIIRYPSSSDYPVLLQRPFLDSKSLESKVNEILSAVKKGGDTSVRAYTLALDRVDVLEFQVKQTEFEQAEKTVSPELKAAILLARKNIEKFHEAQREEEVIVETMPGVTCWRKSLPIEKVGLYIPGGSAPLFSTILMLGIPAKLAGCKEIILCTPPAKDGSVNPAILYTARLVGIEKVFKIGGVQAIGAMAYGTESVPAVYKIFGPGNQYVTCAKQLINKEGVAIDMPAGPSELAVLADQSCVPAFVAADLLSQAEHGADSQVILVTDTEEIIAPIIREVELQLKKLPRKDIAEQALKHSKVILVKDKREAMTLLNAYAPEHLILACTDSEVMAEQVINAGSVFLGNHSCESAGDYASGTNHTLPTNGYAKAYSGVSLDSFVKKITFQKLTAEGIQALGKSIELMAEAEGLDAHKNAVTLRLANKN